MTMATTELSGKSCGCGQTFPAWMAAQEISSAKQNGCLKRLLMGQDAINHKFRIMQEVNHTNSSQYPGYRYMLFIDSSLGHFFNKVN